MNKYEIVRKIEAFAPLETQESWDASGWGVDKDGREVNKILFALTLTDAVVKQARELGCDMIISHHPLFFVPLEYRDINIYSAHTNLDRAEGGTTDTLIKALGFQKSRNEDFARIVELEKPTSVDELREKTERLWKDRERLGRYTENCRSVQFDTTEEYCKKLMEVYKNGRIRTCTD